MIKKHKRLFTYTIAIILAATIIFGTLPVTVIANNSNSVQYYANIVPMDGPSVSPIISTSSLPNGNVGNPYRAVLRTYQSETHTAINWSIQGSLPPGLTLNPVSGVISGAPTTQGTTTFTVNAVNIGGSFDTKELTITIGAALDSAISEIHVSPIQDLHPDFIRGADVSSFLSLYNAGVRFYGFDNQRQCMFVTLAEAGFNYIRLRVWVNPYVYVYTDGSGSPTERRWYGGGNVNADAAIEMGARAAAAGLYTKVAFYYSDTWTSANIFPVPRAWAHTGGAAGAASAARRQLLYDHTFDTVLRMLEAGVMVRMVAIGNEIQTGIAGMSGWGVDGSAMGAFHYGARAVRNAERAFRGYPSLTAEYAGVFPRASLPVGSCTFAHNILIAKHWHNTAASNNASSLMSANADFDIYGISANPQRGHAIGDALTNVMTGIHNTINPANSTRVRHVMIFDTSHPTTPTSGNMHEVTAPRAGHNTMIAPATVQGSASAIRATVNSMNAVDRNPDVIARGGNIGGVFLWEPAWIPESPGITNKPGNWAYNFQRWEEDGTGWASSYMAVVDPANAGIMYGGSTHTNQNVFGWDGRPLANIRVFDYVYRGATPVGGNAIDIFTAGAEPRTQITNTHSTFNYDILLAGNLTEAILRSVLPLTMTAHRMDNTRSNVPITWDTAELIDFANFLNQHENFGSHTRAITGRFMDSVVGEAVITTRYLTVAPTNLVTSHNFGTPAQAGPDNDTPQVSGLGERQWRLDRFAGTNRQIRGRESFMTRSGPFGVGFYRPIPNTFHVAGEVNPRNTNGNLSFDLSQIIPITNLNSGNWFGFEAYVGGEVNRISPIISESATYSFDMILRHRLGTSGGWTELARTEVALDGYRVWSNPRINAFIPPGAGQVQVAFEFRASHGAFGLIDSVYLYRLPPARQLAPPDNLAINPFSGVLSWGEVNGADGYGVYWKNPAITSSTYPLGTPERISPITTDNYFNLSALFANTPPGGAHNFLVRAIGNDAIWTNSELSSHIEFTYPIEISVANFGLYPEEDTITVYEGDNLKLEMLIRLYLDNQTQGSGLLAPLTGDEITLTAYQWHRDGAAIDVSNPLNISEFTKGELAVELDLTPAELSHEGIYTLVVTYDQGAATGLTRTSPPIAVNVIYVDTTPPTVTNVSPSGSNVPITTNQLVITFSEPVMPASGFVDLFTVATPAALSLPIWSANNSVVTFTLTDLEHDTPYTVTIGGFEDLAGNVMAAPHIHIFSTSILPTFPVTVNGSMLPQGINEGQSGQGYYPASATVTVRAGARANYTFNGWTITPSNIVLTNPASNAATFEMPAEPVTVTANWTPIDLFTPIPTPPPTQTPTPIPTPSPTPTPAASPPQPSTPEENHDKILNQIKERTENTPDVYLIMPPGTSYVNINSDSMDAIIEENLNLTIKQGHTTANLPKELLVELQSQANEDDILRIYINVTFYDFKVENTIGNIGNVSLADVDVFAYIGNMRIILDNSEILIKITIDFNNTDFIGLNLYRIIVMDGGTFIFGSPDSNTFIFNASLGSYNIIYAPTLRWIRLQIGCNKIYDFAQETMYVMDAAPLIIENRTLLPVRFVVKAMGGEVDWNPAARVVTIFQGGEVLSFAIGEIAPGMDVPAQIIDNRTFVPLRFVAENFGARVLWDEDTREITIIMIGHA